MLFYKWIKIEEGCEMPADGADVLITIWSDDSYGKGTDINLYTDKATYGEKSWYLDCPIPGCGFTTFNDWDEGQPIKVIAWSPMPIPYGTGWLGKKGV